MYVSVLREIPEFLMEKYVYSDNLIIRGKRLKSCLLLTKNLKFYEFHRKQLLHCIDLKDTILQKVEEQLRCYKGVRGKCFEKTTEAKQDLSALPQHGAEPMETSDLDVKNQSYENISEISFGKYFHMNFENTKLYILLRCWDKLVVLHRISDALGYQLCQEYENISDYHIVHGPIKFQAVIKIEFQNNNIIKTDFQEKPNEHSDEINSNQAPSRNEFKQLMERIRSAKTELQLHKSITQREIERLRNRQAFGENYIRSFKLEEKQILTRYGDIWIRLTANESLVIGVPLVNNCASPNLRILYNLKPIFKVTEAGVCGSSYHYSLYQLKMEYDSLEKVETFFQSNDEAIQAPLTWSANTQTQLLPGEFAVLLIKFKLSQIIALTSCPVFISFEMDKVVHMDAAGGNEIAQRYQQEIYLKTIEFNEILCQRLDFELTFKSSTLHQDFLAIAFTATEMKLEIKFKSLIDLEQFEQLLVAKFNFDVVNQEDSSQSMEICENEDACKNMQNFFQTLYYNKRSSCLWFGTLAVKSISVAKNESAINDNKLKIIWKFYTKNEELAFLLTKLLFDDLILNKCNIEYLKYLPNLENSSIKIIEFENALRRELQILIDSLQNENENSKSNYEELANLQMISDRIAATLLK